MGELKGRKMKELLQAFLKIKAFRASFEKLQGRKMKELLQAFLEIKAFRESV